MSGRGLTEGLDDVVLVVVGAGVPGFVLEEQQLGTPGLVEGELRLVADVEFRLGPDFGEDGVGDRGGLGVRPDLVGRRGRLGAGREQRRVVEGPALGEVVHGCFIYFI